MKAKPLVFTQPRDYFYAQTMDGAYVIYPPGAIHHSNFWAMQYRDEFGVYGAIILRASLDLAKARCGELHQDSFAELIEYWGEK